MAKIKDTDLDIALLREAFFYNPETGELRWRARRRGVTVGQLAGSFDKRGYLSIRFGKHRLLGHRVAWAISFGVWPKDQIDHRSTKPSDNRLENLREATEVQNKANTGAHRDKEFGATKGVYWDKRRGKWMASVYRNGHNKFLGYFDLESDAAGAYAKYVDVIDGEFARAA